MKYIKFQCKINNRFLTSLQFIQMSKNKESFHSYEITEIRCAHLMISANKKLEKVKKQIEQCQAELIQIEQIKNYLIKENDDKTMQLNQLNENIQKMEEKYISVSKLIQESENKCNIIEDKAKTLNREVDELIYSKKIVQNDINEANEQLEFIKSQITIQIEKEKDISQKCEKVDSLRIQMINEANEYQQKIAQKSIEIKDMQSTIENLKKDVAEYENKKEENKKQLDEINKKVNQDLKKLEDISLKTNEVKTEIKLLQDKNDELTKENTELSKENSNLMIQKADLNQRIVEEKNKIEQKQNEYSKIVDELNDITQKKIKSNNELRSIMDDINNNLKIQNEAQIKTCQLRNKLTEYEQEIINSRNEYSLILEHISSTQKMHQDLMNEMVTTASSQKEISDLTNKEKNNFLASISPKKSQNISISSNDDKVECQNSPDSLPPINQNFGL